MDLEGAFSSQIHRDQECIEYRSPRSLTVLEIQIKTEVIKAQFIELATQFECETGTQLHLAVYHPWGGTESAILTCDVKVPEAK